MHSRHASIRSRLLALIALAFLAALPFAAASAGPLADLDESLAKVPVGETPGETAATPPGATATSASGPSFTLALLADVHASPDNLEGLGRIVAAVNKLKPDAVGVLGDLSCKIGSPAELKRAVKALEPLKMTRFVVPGNHDVRSEDKLDADGNKVVASAGTKKKKLERFAKAFGNADNFMVEKRAGNLLVFLPVDALKAKGIATLSDGSLKRFRKVLEAHRDLPTVVFFHAPMLGSVEKAGKKLGKVHGFAQPNDEIRDILRDNPQVYLWVSGHLHISPSGPDFNAPKINTVAGVRNIHCPALKTKPRYFNVLTLDAKGALVRTYDVTGRAFLPRHTRRIANRSTKGDEPAGDDRVVDPGDGTTGDDDPEADDEDAGNGADDPAATVPATETGTTGDSGAPTAGLPTPPPVITFTQSAPVPTPGAAATVPATETGTTGDSGAPTTGLPTPPPAITFTQSAPVPTPGAAATDPAGATTSAAPVSTPTATTPATTASATTPATPIGSGTNRHSGPIVLRAGMALESAALGGIPAGAAVEILSNDGAWCRVRFGGVEGYVRAYYLGLGR